MYIFGDCLFSVMFILYSHNVLSGQLCRIGSFSYRMFPQLVVWPIRPWLVQCISLFKGCLIWCLGAEGGAGLMGGQCESGMFWLSYVMLSSLCLLIYAVIFFSFGTLLYFFVNVFEENKASLFFALRQLPSFLPTLSESGWPNPRYVGWPRRSLTGPEKRIVQNIQCFYVFDRPII